MSRDRVAKSWVNGDSLNSSPKIPKPCTPKSLITFGMLHVIPWPTSIRENKRVVFFLVVPPSKIIFLI